MSNLNSEISAYEQRLKKQLEEAFYKTMWLDVAPQVETIFKTHIIEDIYGSYTPKHNGWVSINPNTGRLTRATYVRRYSLLYPNNIVTKEISSSPGEMTIRITSVASPQPSPFGDATWNNESGLLEIIEGDRHGKWAGGFPRPASKYATNEVDTQIEGWIRQGIQNRTGIVLL